jgi:acetate kinase
MKRLVVLNSGSSSLKYKVFGVLAEVESCTEPLRLLAHGSIDRICSEAQPTPQQPSRIHHATLDSNGNKSDWHESNAHIFGHEHAMQQVVSHLERSRVIGTAASDIAYVGHRVVHGGERFVQATVIDDEIEAELGTLSHLAPLHNPVNLVGIKVARSQLRQAQHVAVFDTAFHSTIPEYASTYALPQRVRQCGIRRFGFHGLSHSFVTSQAAKALGQASTSSVNIISCHLGNGASVAAIRAGRSIDTSMGFTPLEGLPMGTRCGDIDAAIVLHLQRHHNMSVDEIDRLLHHESGLLGLTNGSSNDMRDIIGALENDAHQPGTRQANQLAVQVFAHRVKKYIGAYTALIGARVDALVFTGGIGENAAHIRQLACADMKHLGYHVDHDVNLECTTSLGGDGRAAGWRDIASRESASRILVIATDEERQIAIETLVALAANKRCTDRIQL